MGVWINQRSIYKEAIIFMIKIKRATVYWAYIMLKIQ